MPEDFNYDIYLKSLDVLTLGRRDRKWSLYEIPFRKIRQKSQIKVILLQYWGVGKCGECPPLFLKFPLSKSDILSLALDSTFSIKYDL